MNYISGTPLGARSDSKALPRHGSITSQNVSPANPKASSSRGKGFEMPLPGHPQPFTPKIKAWTNDSLHAASTAQSSHLNNPTFNSLNFYASKAEASFSKPKPNPDRHHTEAQGIDSLIESLENFY